MKKSKLKVKPPSRPSNFMRGGLYNSKYISDSNYQTGGPILKAQNSYLKKLKETETGIDHILGNPMKRAFKNSAPNQDEEPVDNIRHTLGGMYTTEALSKKIPGLPKAFSALGSNILGLSHEVMTLLKDQRPWNEKIPESSEDMLNNFVGSLISLIPFMSESDKEDVIWKLSVNNLLPDGIENTPMGDQYFTEEQQRNLKPALYNRDISEEIFQGGVLPEVLITASRKKQGGQIKTKDSDRAMVYGIADILKMIKNKDNRQQIAGKMIKDFNKENIKYNKQNFLKASNLLQQGGTPDPFGPNPLPHYGDAGNYYKQLMDSIKGTNLFNKPADLPVFDDYYNDQMNKYLKDGKYRPQVDGGKNYYVDTATGEKFTEKQMRERIGLQYDSLKASNKSFTEQAPFGAALAGLFDLQTAEADEMINRKKNYFENTRAVGSWAPMGFSQDGGEQQMPQEQQQSGPDMNQSINVIKAYAEDLGFTNEDGSISKEQMVELLRLLESDVNADLEREVFANLVSFFQESDKEPLHEQIRKYWNRGVIPMNRREDVLKYSSDPIPHLEQGENFPSPTIARNGGRMSLKGLSAIYQNGGGRSAEDQAALAQLKQEQAINWFKQWRNSPRGEDMLRKSVGSEEEFKKIKALRENSLKDLPDVKFIKEQGYHPNKLPKSGVYHHSGDLPKFMIGDNYGISLYPYGLESPTTMLHEVGHAEDKAGKLIPKSDKELINSYRPKSFEESPRGLSEEGKSMSKKDRKGEEKFMQTYGSPKEVRELLNQLRFTESTMPGQIYDPFTEEVTPEIFEKMKNKIYEEKNKNPLDILRKNFTDDQLINMLNTISYNDGGMDSNIQLVQQGGYMNPMQQMMGYKDNSPYRNMPYQTFNTNNLTMRGVSKPLLAISDIGTSTIMQPGYNYTFPGASSVTEIPMAQSGKFFKKVGNVLGDFGRSVADSVGNRYGLWDIDNSKYKTKFGQKYSGAWDKFNRNLGKAGAAAVSALVPGVGTALGKASSAGINRLEQQDLENQYGGNQQMPSFTGYDPNQNLLNQLSFLMPSIKSALLGPSSPYNTDANTSNPYGLPFLNMREGGIPDRYKKLGYTKVGQKRQSDRPGKKWSVLAKKGDKYKIVHGGAEGMSDFTKHKNEKRRDRFWDRMGGKNSAKAKDPFSPLYWHKRFGTWQNGGIIPPPPSRPF